MRDFEITDLEWSINRSFWNRVGDLDDKPHFQIEKWNGTCVAESEKVTYRNAIYPGRSGNCKTSVTMFLRGSDTGITMDFFGDHDAEHMRELLVHIVDYMEKK